MPITVEPATDAQPAIAGTLRAPRQWERMLVEAAVIGGDPERWKRRLRGLAEELRVRCEEASRADPDSSLTAALTREAAWLAHLTAFALPLVTEMAAWPERASWGEWLQRFEQLAPRVLRAPAHVLRVLADLRPMAAVGPVGLDEVRAVLLERLRLVEAEPPARRYGAVFIGTPAQARGRSFRVVFVPGVAERVFPQKPRQDPLLPDVPRRQLSERLETRADASVHERVLLHLAVGAATERLYLSYPRLDVAESRVRVPSFYALDAARGVTGLVPDHEELARAAAAAGDATLAWPAPSDPDQAIDILEHDLAVLRQLFDAADAGAVKGRAQYLLRLNDALRRTVTERWARGGTKWTQYDGLVRVADRTREALAAQRLTAREYSVSALQRYATCPYQFLLGAIHRLRAAEHPEPLQRLDPLTKGSIVHRMQAEAMRALAARDRLPLDRDRLDEGLQVLADVIARVADEYRERLVPAIERVWKEEMEAIARDLRGWLRHVAADEAWEPRYFELSFGLPRGAGPRSAQPSGSCPDRRALPAARRHRRHRRAPSDESAAGHRSQDRQGPHEGHAGDLRRQCAAAARLRGGRRVDAGRAGRRIAAVLLHLGRRLQAAAGAARPGDEAAGDRGVRGDRSRRRARHAGADARRGRVHLVRLPAGMRPRGGAARARKPQAHMTDLIWLRSRP